MKLQVIRYSSSPQSTLGLLMIDNQFACYTLEDEFQEKKIAGETRIPSGHYPLKLRKEGSQNQHYQDKFPDMHKGMLHVCEVPGFKYIHIHIGNFTKDTDGCLLLGDGANNNQTTDGQISNSKLAYTRIYPKIAAAIEAGEVWITYTDQIPNEITEDVHQAQVNVDHLNLRTAPYSDIEGILKQNTAVNIIKSEDGWSQVQVEGWVSSEFLES